MASINRAELSKIVGSDQRLLRAFERVLNQVQATIIGPSSVALNYANDGTLTSPLPVTASYTLTPEGGVALGSGVSWGVVVLSGEFAGLPPVIAGTGAAQLQIRSGLVSPTALLAITARVNGVGYAPLSVTVSKSIAAPDVPGGGATASDSTSSFVAFNTTSFAPITRELMITLPTGVTTASLVAASLTLSLFATGPSGTTDVEFKWQRESAPSVWSDVGGFGTAAILPRVMDEGGGIFVPVDGTITINRNASGMVAASAQKFRLVARVSGGNLRDVAVFGTASVTA